VAEGSLRRVGRRVEKRQEGQDRREAFPATGKGKPLEAEAQGRFSHETRRDGFRVEESVKRLRKPEGAAQPGEVIPVLVATPCLKRRRVKQPHGRADVVCEARLRCPSELRRASSGHTLNVTKRA
jgi:hypothetical protein